jgi:hypothetical protein
MYKKYETFIIINIILILFLSVVLNIYFLFYNSIKISSMINSCNQHHQIRLSKDVIIYCKAIKYENKLYK